MKRSVIVLGLGAIAALGPFPAGGLAALSPPGPPMSIKVLSVAPRVVTRTNQPITVRVRYTGIAMDPLHMGGKPVFGHGHMQIYLERIPAVANRHADMKDVVANASTSTFTLVLTSRWRKAARGHHHFLVALAQNDYVLYTVKPASFSLTVR